MTRSVDLSPPRRPIFFPVVIATVFLTIIGMTGGFLLGERHRRQQGAATEQTPESTSGQPDATRSLSSDGPLCPPETQQTALLSVGQVGDLHQVFKVQTDNQTTVWICKDAGGNLYYQGKTGGLDAPLVEGTNALFLDDVTEPSPGRYSAKADNGNRFIVDRSALVIHFAKGGTETHKVVSD